MFEFLDFFTAFKDFMPNIFEALFALVTAASAITALTKTPADDTFVGKIYKVIEFIALNVGYAKDQAPKKGGKGGRFVAG